MDIFSTFPALTHAKKNDYFIIIVSLLFSTICFAYLVRKDEVMFRRDLHKIAVVNQSTSNVKRKFSGTINWDKITTEDVIYQGDSVFTGKNSDVNISFNKNKSKLSIPQNSLIRIEETDNQFSIEIKKGGVDISLAQKTKLKVKNGVNLFSISSEKASQVSIFSRLEEILITPQVGKILIKNGKDLLYAKKNEQVVIDKNKILSKNISSIPAVSIPKTIKHTPDEAVLDIMSKIDKKMWNVEKIENK
jgi:hypothetical protein